MIALSGVAARVGAFMLRDVALTVPAGGYGVVIGPAGSGKTTLLEVIAGLLPVTAGRVTIAGQDVAGVPPEAREVALVYQHALLFPHLTVAENVAYGARDAAHAREVHARLGIDALTARPVASLSGGERQLVALARALARRPKVLLLDEPFSALDPRRRAEVRRIVRQCHREWGLTTLQVTHDFTEAGLLGDVAVLLDSGAVLQAGPPAELFRHPATASVAAFLGAENIYAGVVTERSTAVDGMPRELEFHTSGLVLHAIGDAVPGPAHAVIRAEEIVVARDAASGSARNRVRARVVELATLGALTRVVLDADGVPIIAALTTRSADELALAPGMEVTANWKAMAVHLC
ncbi:MAG: ABC transporter ATP-binding protein [Gemmatimonadaceae bacterium]|nr:ABC transporter ATP-binding protein [Gemmatimonadaceae bacterium]